MVACDGGRDGSSCELSCQLQNELALKVLCSAKTYGMSQRKVSQELTDQDVIRTLHTKVCWNGDILPTGSLLLMINGPRLPDAVMVG